MKRSQVPLAKIFLVYGTLLLAVIALNTFVSKESLLVRSSLLHPTREILIGLAFLSFAWSLHHRFHVHLKSLAYQKTAYILTGIILIVALFGVITIHHLEAQNFILQASQ